MNVHTYAPLQSSQGRELLKRGYGQIRRSEVKSLYLGDPRFPEAFVDQYIELLERFEIAVAVSQTMYVSHYMPHNYCNRQLL